MLVQAPETRYPAALEMAFTSDVPITISSPKLSIVPFKASSRPLVKSRLGRESFREFEQWVSIAHHSPTDLRENAEETHAEDGTLTIK